MGNSRGILLELDLTAPIVDGPVDPLTRLTNRGQLPLRLAVEALHHAARDERVVGLIAQSGGTRTGLAHIQELREAILAFRKSGKPAVTWAESFGELTAAMSGYYLATAFDEIWLQPSGHLGLHGLAVAAPFLRDALEKVGIEPLMSQRFEYKNAADSLMRTELSPAHRESLSALVDSLAHQLIGGMAAGRGIDGERMPALVDSAPIEAANARAQGLVDHLGYRGQAYSAMLDRLGATDEQSPTKLLLSRYQPATRTRIRRRAAALSHRGSGQVALVHLRGTIRTGHASPAPFASDVASTSVVAALHRIAQDDKVAAVVLRVDSPGGSYVGSDAIWHAVGQVRESGRPVVAAMGNVAASGGYYVCMGADHIVATPATVTGSIGVLAGKVLVNGLLDKVGLHVEDVTVGRRATMPSLRHRYDEDQQAALESWLDLVYWDFVGKAAQGRGMTDQEIHAIAKGRVWTGYQALQNGLVDQPGGTGVALRKARRLAGLGPDATVLEMPTLRPWDVVRGPRSADDPGAGATGWIPGWGALAPAAAMLGLPPAGPLTLPYPVTFR